MSLWYVVEMEPGIEDDAVLELANREGALLLTAGKDFGELVFRQSRVVRGVVLIRLAGMTPEKKAHAVAIAIAQHGIDLPGAFTVISRTSIRIRRQNR